MRGRRRLVGGNGSYVTRRTPRVPHGRRPCGGFLAGQRQLPAARLVCSRTCLRRTDSSSGPISRVAPSAAQPAAVRNGRSASSAAFTQQQARPNPSARSVSAQAFSSREPWPRCCAAGSTTNTSIAPSRLRSASSSWLGIVVASPQLAGRQSRQGHGTQPQAVAQWPSARSRSSPSMRQT